MMRWSGDDDDNDNDDDDDDDDDDNDDDNDDDDTQLRHSAHSSSLQTRRNNGTRIQGKFQQTEIKFF